jgi:hypothetical protein
VAVEEAVAREPRIRPSVDLRRDFAAVQMASRGDRARIVLGADTSGLGRHVERLAHVVGRVRPVERLIDRVLVGEHAGRCRVTELVDPGDRRRRSPHVDDHGTRVGVLGRGRAGAGDVPPDAGLRLRAGLEGARRQNPRVELAHANRERSVAKERGDRAARDGKCRQRLRELRDRAAGERHLGLSPGRRSNEVGRGQRGQDDQRILGFHGRGSFRIRRYRARAPRP